MKKSCCCSETTRNIGLLALRVGVGFLFIYQGWMKFKGIEATGDMFGTWGFPIPMALAYVVATLELVGGVAVLLGVFTRIAAMVLAVIMVVALVVVHAGMENAIQNALLPILALGATLGLYGVGAGDWRLLKKECVCKA